MQIPIIIEIIRLSVPYAIITASALCFCFAVGRAIDAVEQYNTHRRNCDYWKNMKADEEERELCTVHYPEGKEQAE